MQLHKLIHTAGATTTNANDKHINTAPATPSTNNATCIDPATATSLMNNTNSDQYLFTYKLIDEVWLEGSIGGMNEGYKMGKKKEVKESKEEGKK